ncbi:MAG: DUF1588 domain-containing protein [Bdellovibrionota bacterium]
MQPKLRLSPFQLVAILLSTAATLLSFQNCSEFAPLDLASTNGGFDAAAVGKVLYASNCASCHGDVDASAKANRTSGQIFEAIRNVPQMASLSGLSADDVTAISVALSIPLPGSQIKLKFQCADPQKRGVSDKKMKRLTRVELVNTLNDLLGSTIVANSSIQTQLSLMPNDVPNAEVTDVPEIHADTHAGALFEIAATASDLVFANTAVRDRIFGSCSGQATITDACAQTFINSFGLKTLRRPLATAESASLLTYFKASGGVEGLKRVFMRLMTSPSLAFHLETGGTATTSRVRLTDHEIASRISYRLLGTMPDAELFTAAGNGELQDMANVRSHVKRLLAAHPLAKARVDEFFNFYLQTAKIPNPSAAAGADRGIDVNGLRAELLQEIADYVNNNVWTKQASFKALMNSTDVFPRSDRMATILETTKAAGATASRTTASHSGLILRPGFLAGAGDRTNPMHRAVLIRKRLLCQNLGSPDPAQVAQQTQAVGDVSNLPNREAYTKLTQAPQCMTCHGMINPVGFALENYDQLGMWRTRETVYKNGQVAASYPIDSRTGDPLLEAGGPTALVMPEDLVTALANGNGARSCFAEMVFEYQRMRSIEADDGCALREVETASLESGSLLEAFTTSIANDDIFWKSKEN